MKRSRRVSHQTGSFFAPGLMFWIPRWQASARGSEQLEICWLSKGYDHCHTDIVLCLALQHRCSYSWLRFNYSFYRVFNHLFCYFLMVICNLVIPLKIWTVDKSVVEKNRTDMSHLPTDNTVSSPSFFSFTSLPSTFSGTVFGTAACVWWVSTNTPPSRGLFCWSVDVSREGRMRVWGGFRGSFRESRGGMRIGGHFLWAQRVHR